MTSSFSKKVYFDRLPDDRRRPFFDRWQFRRGFPIGSDVDFDVPAVSRGVMGDAVPSAHVKLGRLDENSLSPFPKRSGQPTSPANISISVNRISFELHDDQVLPRH